MYNGIPVSVTSHEHNLSIENESRVNSCKVFNIYTIIWINLKIFSKWWGIHSINGGSNIRAIAWLLQESKIERSHEISYYKVYVANYLF